MPLDDFAANFRERRSACLSADEALKGARHIIAERISENADFRKVLRQMMMREGIVVSQGDRRRRRSRKASSQMYSDYREPVAKIPSHRMLAIRRGAKEDVLYFEIELDPSSRCTYLHSTSHSRARATGFRTSNWRIEDCLQAPAQSVHPDRSPPGIEGPLRRRSHPGLPRESGEPAAGAARRPCSACWPSIPASAPAAKSPWSTTPASFSSTRVIYPLRAEERRRRLRRASCGHSSRSTTCAPSRSATAPARAKPTPSFSDFLRQAGLTRHLQRRP